MATQTVLIDDMDGTKADTTIAFIIQGDRYSIDLSEKNAKKFWEALNPYIQAAKGLDAAHNQAVEAEVVAVEQRTAIRDWARKKGFDVSARGRIPAAVEEAFRESHKA